MIFSGTGAWGCTMMILMAWAAAAAAAAATRMVCRTAGPGAAPGLGLRSAELRRVAGQGPIHGLSSWAAAAARTSDSESSTDAVIQLEV